MITKKVLNTFDHFGRARKIAIIILFVLCAFQVCFIFSNSLKNADMSHGQSGVYVRFFIEKILRLDYSLQSEEFISTITVFIRKTAHFCEYALFGSLIFTMLFFGMYSYRKCFFISVFACFITGNIDEFLQRFSMGRSCSFFDALIDTAGGLVACGILLLIVKFTFFGRYSHYRKFWKQQRKG